MPSGFDPGAAGVSSGGNSAGTTGSQILGTLVLAGGANITLSQSTAAGRATVSVVGGAGGAGFTGGISGGNTSGDTGTVAGSLILAGGNNITLSGATAAGGAMTVTVSAGAGGGAGYTAGLSNIGNTSGDTGVVTARLVLAGGNNVTLSGSTNAGSMTVTISAANETQTVPPIATAVKGPVSTVASTGTITRFSPEDHQHQGINSAGISNIGNTAGTSGAGPGRLVLAGGNQVTLSQNTDATGSTVTISMAETQTVAPIGTSVEAVASASSVGTITRFAPEDHRHAGVFSAGVSNVGNTSGDTIVTVGRWVLAGGNNVTLSVGTAANRLHTITISAANETQTVPPIGTSVEAVASASSVGTVTRFAPEDHRHAGVFSAGVSNVGNTSGNTTVQAGRLVLAGGNNVTLSVGTAAGGLQTVTISAANETQTVPPIATAVVQDVSTVASTGTITRFAPEDHMHRGVNSIGISTMGNTAGTTAVSPGRMVLVGTQLLTLSQATDATGSTLTIQGPRVLSVSRYDNASYNSGNVLGVGLNTQQTQLQMFPFCPPEDVFPGNMTVSTLLFDLSGSGGAGTSGSYQYSFSVGLYTINSTNVSVLTLLNSASTSWSSAAAAGNSSLWHGPRWLSIHSSLFSAAWNLSQTSYWMGVVFSSVGNAYSLSLMGDNLGDTGNNRSGTLGAAGASNASVGWYPYAGYVATAGIPASINISALTHTGASGGFVPHFVAENLLSKY